MDNPLDNDGLMAQPAPKPVPVPAATDTPIAEPAAEPKGHGGGKPPKKRANTWLYVGIVAGVLVVAGIAGAVFVPKLIQGLPGKVDSVVKAQEPQGPLKGYVKGSIAHLVTYAQPKTIPDVAFVDRDKKPVKLSDFKGQVVVLNVWATWCAPCRFEMPTLANLQRAYDGKGLKVVALSVDESRKFDDVKSFIDVQEPLTVYVDTTFAAPSQLEVSGMPVTIVLDKEGRAVARLDGDASWDTPEARALMDKLLAE